MNARIPDETPVTYAQHSEGLIAAPHTRETALANGELLTALDTYVEAWAACIRATGTGIGALKRQAEQARTEAHDRLLHATYAAARQRIARQDGPL